MTTTEASQTDSASQPELPASPALPEGPPSTVQAEPAIGVGTIVAGATLLVDGLIAFGLVTVTPDQKIYLLGFIGLIAPLIVGFVTRGKVFSPATVKALIDYYERTQQHTTNQLIAARAENGAVQAVASAIQAVVPAPPPAPEPAPEPAQAPPAPQQEWMPPDYRYRGSQGPYPAEAAPTTQRQAPVYPPREQYYGPPPEYYGRQEWTPPEQKSESQQPGSDSGRHSLGNP